MRKSTLEKKVKELKALKLQKKELEVQIEILENELKQDMLKTGVFNHSGEDWSLSWKLEHQSRFSQSDFKKDHPKLFKKYQELKEYRRFLIS